MILIVREYLSMLKESKELDSLLVNLLLAMGIEPWSSPQIGVRQDGVDVAAVGTDPEDGKRKVFLFVIKRGDIDRRSWATGTQAVRPTLEEVLDTYIPNRIPREFAKIPIMIVLCCGGKLHQEVESNWAGFTRKHGTSRHLNFSFWGADHLTLLINRHMLNEFLFPDACQKLLRKTLATIGDPDAGIRHYVTLVNELLSKTSSSSTKNAVKTLKTINLSLRIVYHWCKDADDLNPAYLATEHTVLGVWDWQRTKKVWNRKAVVDAYIGIFNTYLDVSGDYFVKLRPHCLVQDGLGRYAHPNSLELHLWVYDVMGRIACHGLNLLHIYSVNHDERIVGMLDAVAKTLVQLIKNNPIALSPIYDGHATEISLVLMVFYSLPKYHDVARQWIDTMIGKISFSYTWGSHYPVSSDSYDDLIEMEFRFSKSKTDLTQLSTLFPILAEWCLLYRAPDLYKRLRQVVTTIFSHTDLQMWFPDAQTDDHLYKANAGRESGATYCSMKLPETLDELEVEVATANKKVFDARELSCIKEGMPMLAMISSRHHRTPMVPYLWQRLILDNKPDTPPNTQGATEAE